MLPYFEIDSMLYHSINMMDKIKHQNCGIGIGSNNIKLFCNLNKLLRRYGLSFERLKGRSKSFAIKFYHSLNEIIKEYNTYGLGQLSHYFDYDMKQDCYNISLKYEPSAKGFEINIRTINTKDFINVLQYYIPYTEIQKGILFVIILGGIMVNIDSELSHYHDDKEKIYPIIKKLLYAILKIDKDLDKYRTYKNHKLILRQFYCVKGFGYYKHLLFKTVPKTMKFELKK